MNIPAIAAAGVNAAFTAAASVLLSATVKTGATVSIDVETDQASTTYANTDSNVEVLKYGETTKKEDGGGNSEGQKEVYTEANALMKRSQLSVVPTVDSIVTIGSDDWKVFDVQTPPGDAVVILKIRK